MKAHTLARRLLKEKNERVWLGVNSDVIILKVCDTNPTANHKVVHAFRFVKAKTRIPTKAFVARALAAELANS